MKMLIAGGGGFIGSHLLSQYKEQNATTSIDHSIDSTGKDFIDLDLTNVEQVNSFADNCDHYDVIIFLVGLAHAKGKGKDLPEFNKVNYQTVVNLLTALSKVGKIPNKIIFASTISIYGERYEQNTYNETTKPKPFSPYAVTKLQAEQYLLDNFGNKSWMLRFAPVYSLKFLLNIDRRTKIGNKYYKVGNGNKKLSLCNIENIHTAVKGIIDGAVPSGIYNLSDSTPYSYNDLLNHQGASFIFRIPVLAIRLVYILGRITNNIFLKENSTKLISNNIFPSNKIRKYIQFNSTISNLKTSND